MLKNKKPHEEEWWINKPENKYTKALFENKKNKKSQNATVKGCNDDDKWLGMHSAPNLTKLTQISTPSKDCISLDSNSNVTVFNGKSQVCNVKNNKKGDSMSTNGKGRLNLNTTYKAHGMSCEAFCNKDSMSNTISLADMADDYRVTMDTNADKAMFVHLPHKIVRFGQMKNRLCGLDQNDKSKNCSPEQCNDLF